jgi:hypothetical protein
LRDRAQQGSAKVTATIHFGRSITLAAEQAIRVPVTGARASGAETYGAFTVSRVSVPAGGTVTIPLVEMDPPAESPPHDAGAAESAPRDAGPPDVGQMGADATDAGAPVLTPLATLHIDASAVRADGLARAAPWSPRKPTSPDSACAIAARGTERPAFVPCIMFVVVAFLAAGRAGGARR